MRKISLAVIFLVSATALFAQNRVGLQEAVDAFADEFTSRFRENRTIAVFGLETDRHDLMVTFVDTMNEQIQKHNRNAMVVERRRIEVLQRELDFSMTGRVSDNTAQLIGRFIGADILIYGELRKVGKATEYRMTIKATVTETALILLTRSYDLQIGHDPYFWSVGVSVGTAFTSPFLIGTIHGTLAPLPYSFLELGVDLGTLSGKPDVDYYSVYPYANCAFFLPFDKGGWYIGAGIGYLWSMESSADLEYRYRIIAMNITTGFNIANMFDISYTLRTNFESAGSKLSVGYTYRF